MNKDLVCDKMCRTLIDICACFILNGNKTTIKQDEMNTLLKMSLQQKIFPIVYATLDKNCTNKLLEYINKTQINRINNLIQQSIELDNTRNNISICKGFVLSKLLYGNPYMRMFNDIDVYTTSDNMLSQCLKMEQLGYSCKYVKLFKDRINLKNEYINIYYSTAGEKKFFRNNDEAMIEVKNCGHYFDCPKNDEAVKNCIVIDVNDYKFNTFNLQDSFVLCYENMYDNFFGPWGIQSEHTLRDIVDITAFIIHYPELFTENFLNKLMTENRLERLGKIIHVIEAIFSCYPELIEKIPKILLEMLPDLDVMISKDVLLDRIFDSKKRVREWKESSYRTAIEGEKQYFKAFDLSKSCYDYKNGVVELFHPCIMDRIVNGSLHAPIYYSSNYDNENLIFSYCIPKKYSGIQLYLCFLKCNIEEKYEDEIICNLYADGTIKKKKYDIEFDTFVTEYDDCYMLSVVIEKEKISLFETETHFEVYFSFKIFLVDENINNNSPIARSNYIGQPAIKIPIK